MSTFHEFEQALLDTLPQLYHPAYPVPEALVERLGGGPQEGSEAIRAAILQAIEALRPDPEVPACARSWRIYQILSFRYVHKLTQEETAERLSITPRHLRREQRMAVEVLARRLWGEDGGGQAAPVDLAQLDADAWRSQVRQELASLQKSAPGGVAGVGETMRSVAALVQPFLSTRGIALELDAVEPGLNAAIHPSQLSQVLVASVTRLARATPGGSIRLRAGRQGGRVMLTVSGGPVAQSPADVSGDYITDEVLAMHGGSIEATTDGEVMTWSLSLPAAGRIRVLVVDDNADLVHFFQRYVQGTQYDIVGVPEGLGVLDAVEEVAPAVIVLDVMLPDVDGWELLAQLHEHVLTRAIPIIVCSVVREEELSLALGAALYVPKPVRRAEFLQALDRVLSPAARGGAGSPESSSAVC